MAIPNSQILMGSARNKFAVMAYLRAEGFADAAPDLMLAYPKEGKTGHLFCGMFIEMKKVGVKARPDQVEFAGLLRKMGYNALICAGADEAIRSIRAYVERSVMDDDGADLPASAFERGYMT